MKVRQQTPKPCEKKGCDNHFRSNLCKIRDLCRDLGGYLTEEAAGTQKYEDEGFVGCMDIEEYLTANHLIRYETRELTGLEVLFDGIESSDSVDDFIYDDRSEFTLYDSHMSNVSLDSKFRDIGEGKFYSSEEYEIREELVPVYSKSQSRLNYFSKELALSQSSAHEILASAPKNLYDSLYPSIYAQGIFTSQHQDSNKSEKEKIKLELEADDLAIVALIVIKEIDDIQEIKSLWPRYTEARYLKNKNTVYARLDKRMPFWAKRFNEIWKILTEPQTEAILLEFFYDEEEKPTQKENAEKLGISIASYQDRLEGGYKHFEKLYPEFTRVRRRNTRKPVKTSLPAPLYELRNNEIVKVSHPIKKERRLTSLERIKIRDWTQEKIAFVESYKDLEAQLVERESAESD